MFHICRFSFLILPCFLASGLPLIVRHTVNFVSDFTEQRNLCWTYLLIVSHTLISEILKCGKRPRKCMKLLNPICFLLVHCSVWHIYHLHLFVCLFVCLGGIHECYYTDSLPVLQLLIYFFTAFLPYSNFWPCAFSHFTSLFWAISYIDVSCHCYIDDFQICIWPFPCVQSQLIMKSSFSHL